MNHCRYYSYNSPNFLSPITDEKDLFNLDTPMQLKQTFSKHSSRNEATLHKVLYIIRLLSFKIGQLHPEYLLGTDPGS